MPLSETYPAAMSETQIGSVVFEELNNYDHEQVVCRDRVSGLRGDYRNSLDRLRPCAWWLSDVSLSVGA